MLAFLVFGTGASALVLLGGLYFILRETRKTPAGNVLKGVLLWLLLGVAFGVMEFLWIAGAGMGIGHLDWGERGVPPSYGFIGLVILGSHGLATYGIALALRKR